MPAERALLMGNEAIARGALEAGVSFCAGYPGNPSSEIIDTLRKAKPAYPFHAEWSVNEIVAMEAAAAAAFSGLKALCSMKQNGINVCVDFLTTVNLTGTNGGSLLVVVCDDPGPLTSSNEEDSRFFAKLAMLPLLEPSTPQEAKDMTAWALEASGRWELPVMLRSVSRLSHGRGTVELGELPLTARCPWFDVSRPLAGAAPRGPDEPPQAAGQAGIASPGTGGCGLQLLSGTGTPELVGHRGRFGLPLRTGGCDSWGGGEVGLLKLGAVWPLPSQSWRRHWRAANACWW